MKRRNHLALRLIAACGAAAGLGTPALAQPYVINESGATLLENFLKAPASTNDYIDVDGNGVARIFGTNQQLAPFGLPPGGAGQWWIVQYRAVGSVNGFQELVDFGRNWATGANGVEISAGTASKAYHNRTQYINNGASFNAIYNEGNPGAAPVRSTMPAGFLQSPTATYAVPPNGATGGIRIDMAPVDVPAAWAVFNSAGAPAYDLNPTQPGYGYNEVLSRNKDGTPTSFNHLLANLGTANLNAITPDENTIFDTSICFAPIACVTNLGTGMAQIDQSNIRHLLASGRLVSGENIVAVTRDSGSGTRNGYCNSMGLDPSWGVGDNIGALSVLAAEHILGPDFISTNKVGNGEVETTTRNHRLAIGYAGAERGVNSGWLTGGSLEILAVRFDLQGGTEYSRPTIHDVLDNDADGYLIGGPAIFAHFGDPRSAPVSKGGDPGNTNPDMRNVEGAAFINNITRSIAAFKNAPGGDPTLFTPGEFLATQLILVNAQDYLQDKADPIHQIANANLNQVLQDFTRVNNVLGNAAYVSFGNATLNGKVPTRKTGVTYSDGVTGAQNYFLTQDGAQLSYGSALNSRNRISGDFNGDARRDLNDAPEMVAAWKQRNGGPVWPAPNGTGPIAGAPGTDASIEILGDFNGDGNFDAEDLRYWADGLAMDTLTQKLDRAKGFKAVDDAFAGNFFGTTLATGGPYANGYSAGDVANAAGTVTPGFAPIGADGIIDDADIDYVYDQFMANAAITGGEANWSDTGEAARFDLSADVTGDLIVNQADITRLVTVILGTSMGDVNLDGQCDQTDLTIAQGHLNQSGGWADGDVNGDGTVTQADLTIISGCGCYPDCDGNAALNVNDYICFQTKFALGDPYADCDNNGVRNVNDYICFQTKFALGC